MDKAPAFQFYPKDFYSDEHVQLMSLSQEGAYMRLLSHQFLHGSIPIEMREISKILRVKGPEGKRLWNGIKPCFQIHPEEPGRLVNPRMYRDQLSALKFRAARAKSGKYGAKSR